MVRNSAAAKVGVVVTVSKMPNRERAEDGQPSARECVGSKELSW